MSWGWWGWPELAVMCNVLGTKLCTNLYLCFVRLRYSVLSVFQSKKIFISHFKRFFFILFFLSANLKAFQSLWGALDRKRPRQSPCKDSPFPALQHTEEAVVRRGKEMAPRSGSWWLQVLSQAPVGCWFSSGGTEIRCGHVCPEQ